MILRLSETWIALLAALVPFIAAAAVKPASSNRLRAVIAIAASAVITLIDSLQVGDNDLSTLAGSFTTAMVVALASYLGLAKHLNVNQRLLPKVGL